MAMAVNCFRVSQLNELAQDALKSFFGPEVWVVGEIQGLKVHTKSGHIYFDLVEKPSGTTEQYVAKVNCAFFKGSLLTWRRTLQAQGFDRFDLVSGLEIKARARVDLYVKEGRYQLIISEIDPSYTLGAIERKRAQTIESLRNAGLMNTNKGHSIASPPLNIGLITSYASAAYNDFISILKKSGYAFRITLCDTYMQGGRTIREVVRALHTLEKDPAVDTIAIIRGGGARTDLFSFDDLAVCKAIALSSKPVLTGIGHEIDLSVADMVAHTHFVTPTDVAVSLVEKTDAVWMFLEEVQEALGETSLRVLADIQRMVSSLGTNLVHVTKRWIDTAGYRLQTTGHILYRLSMERLSHQRGQLLRLQSALHQCTLGILGDQREQLLALESFFSLMRPSEILKRGYSITLNSLRQPITDTSAVGIQETITTLVHKGKILSSVTGKE